MPFKPPLSRDQLRAIQDRNRDSQDVIDLLWEIRRLHSIELRLYQLVKSMPSASGALGMIRDAALNEIKDDPIIKDRDQWADEALNP